ncbi:hypothetical protein GCM10011321_25750 [Youhaiella tibetensis]|uniref:Uncharacterized protein n=1 Tax=Paradevosia tibetensis TaxID=1447062 RepID=A0A5B9DJD8_9HYPH|nr:hypothetical protein [Youhaiella tibetensis]QEE19411.1 hypothetical protein FNA67_04135 [Youhaiella tibetensis]GGF33415.1 hypothetical protein GCM10011321_25750 [Youhaiella tibetensis]
MPGRYRNRAENLEGPAAHGFSVTPDDATALPEITRALYVGVDGDVSVEFVSGANALLAGVPGGTLLPIRVAKVLASGTTAEEIVGLV